MKIEFRPFSGVFRPLYIENLNRDVIVNTNSWIHTFFWLCGMLPIRATAGGFHASSPIKCNLLTISVFILNIVTINLLKNYMTIYLFLFLLGMTLFSILQFAPVDHKNKVLEEEEFIIAKRKSYISGIIMVGLCMMLALYVGRGSIITISIMMGVFTASISLIIGSIKRGGEKNENDEYYS